MFKNRFLYIVALLGTAAFFLFYQQWLAWFCLGILLLIPVLSLIMCLFSRGVYQLFLTTPRNVKMGDKAILKIKVSQKYLPGLSISRVDILATEKMTGNTKTYRVFAQGETEVGIPIDTTHCGAFRMEVKSVKVYDLFGLFCTKKNVKNACEVLIQPIRRIPEAIPDLNGFKAKTLRRSQSPYTEIYDVRDYVIGDPIKNIHWKASAKKDALMVKEPQEECFGHARVFLEFSEDRDIFDRRMGELLFTSDYFLKKELPHKIRVLPPLRREIAFDIQSQRDLDKAVIRILNMKIPKEEPDET